MTFIWLIVWLIQGTPNLHVPTWTSWSISLLVCIVIDVLGIMKERNG